MADRALDSYTTPVVATKALLAIEAVPRRTREPAAGDGAIVRVLEAAGHVVHASDVVDYGAGYKVADYLTAEPPAGTEGIVTNPPYRLAIEFIQKALAEVAFSAWLLRTNFLESTSRLPFFRGHPPARIWISSRRLPMMHRTGWTGPRAPSNTCHAWFVWNSAVRQKRIVDWFDWRAIAGAGASTKAPVPSDATAAVLPPLQSKS